MPRLHLAHTSCVMRTVAYTFSAPGQPSSSGSPIWATATLIARRGGAPSRLCWL